MIVHSAFSAKRAPEIIPKQKSFLQVLYKYRYLYFLLLPLVLFYVIFCYLPMAGVVIAFQDYRITRSIFDSEWVGFKHFISFFNSYNFFQMIRNTLSISIYGLVFAFPLPIILALLLNEIRITWFKKTVQTISYMPHFISVVVVCSIVIDFVSNRGIINEIITAVGGGSVNFITEPQWFYPIYIISGIWQQTGWDSIIYLAALTAIDITLYEAAIMDGAGRFKQAIHITLPGIASTVVIILILRIGSLMSVGYEKILLLYNPAIYSTADVISTFVYRKGILGATYSYAAAVGLFNSVVNFILVFTANHFSKKMGQASLW